MNCELCLNPDGELLAEDAQLRVLLINEPAFPGFCRVIWKQHIKEMTDLSHSERHHLMDWVFRTEKAIRHIMQPSKINLASLGNVVPHLHWHIIPRFEQDSHFPQAIWAKPVREVTAPSWPQLAQQLRQQLIST
ncbi:HIT family protein [Neisseriaceae bacterium TC5R-5]|nr:HIT family protein [Neisseriaceae bacterium TC5R-5]